MPKLEPHDEPIFERGPQFAGTFLQRRPKRNHPFACRNATRESSILQLVKFGLGNCSFQVFAKDVADRHRYSIRDETQDVKQYENRAFTANAAGRQWWRCAGYGSPVCNSPTLRVEK